MGVAVDEPRYGDTTPAVELLDVALYATQVGHAPDCAHAAVLAEHVAVLDDLDGARLLGPAQRRAASGRRHDLSEAADEKLRHAREPRATDRPASAFGGARSFSGGPTRRFETVFARRLPRLVIAGVEMAQDTRARIGRQHALETLRALVGPVGDHDHARVDRIADADPAAMVHAHPRRTGCRVQEGVEDRPVRDGIRSVLHRLRLPVRGRNRARVEMIAPDHHWGRDATRADEVVDRKPRLCAIAVAEPADPRRETLERHALGCQFEPLLEEPVVREELAQRP